MKTTTALVMSVESETNLNSCQIEQKKWETTKTKSCHRPKNFSRFSYFSYTYHKCESLTNVKI